VQDSPLTCISAECPRQDSNLPSSGTSQTASSKRCAYPVAGTASGPRMPTLHLTRPSQSATSPQR
jgi:hypothetical protein